MFHETGLLFSREDYPVVDTTNNSGWLWIESSVDAPNRNTTQKQLEEKFEKKGIQGQSPTTYIVGSQISKYLNCFYFDSLRTSSRLLGCHYEAKFFNGLSPIVRTDPDGKLEVSSWFTEPTDHDVGIGGRSEEKIKA